MLKKVFFKIPQHLNLFPTSVLEDRLERLETPTSVTFGTPIPTASPTVATDVPVRIPSSGNVPIQQLTVACKFLSHANNLTKCQSLTSFDRAATGVTNIPTEIGLLTQLTSLSLFQNGLTGTIPSTLGNLIQLTTLNLFDNELTGTIPSALGNLIQLTDLSLSFNLLNGLIPSTLGNLMQMKSLFLYNNPELRGTVPSPLCSLPGIAIGIDCDNCEVVCSCCNDGFSGPPCALFVKANVFNFTNKIKVISLPVTCDPSSTNNFLFLLSVA